MENKCEKKTELLGLILETIRKDREQESHLNFSDISTDDACKIFSKYTRDAYLDLGLTSSYKPIEPTEVERLIDPITGYYYYKSKDGKETIYTSNEKPSILQRLIAFLRTKTFNKSNKNN